MKSMRAVTELEATPTEVWAALMDLPSWPQWASFHPTADGPIALGVGLSMRFAVRSLRVTGRARFTVVEPEKSLWWRGGLGPILRIEHGFDLRATRRGSTRIAHEERFSGLLGPLVVWALGPDQPAKYAKVNEALGRYLAN